MSSSGNNGLGWSKARVGVSVRTMRKGGGKPISSSEFFISASAIFKRDVCQGRVFFSLLSNDVCILYYVRSISNIECLLAS